MNSVYDFKLVALSMIVAIIASYTALELAGQISTKRGRSTWWLLGSAISMGIGIWSMHFIGMLAFHLPIPMAYDFSLTALSMAIAIVASGLALVVVKQNHSPKSITAGATMMGIGICAMHYTGMFSMKMFPSIQYDPILFITSVIIAIVASFAALWITVTQLQEEYFSGILAKLGGAVLMGLAIAGMHYTGMAAAHFSPNSICQAVNSTASMDNATLAIIIGITAVGFMLVTLGMSMLYAHYAAHTSELADSLQAANEQLRSIALYDGLTGLPNRFLLKDRLDQAILHADRNGTSFALLFIDLDRFKPVNDSFGHHIGDMLLIAVAIRMEDCIRKSDTIARTGGDEFLVVLNKISSTGEVEIVCNKMIEALSQPFHIENHELNISCSIGIGIYPSDGKEKDILIKNADAAMYSAKKTGRSKLWFHSWTN